MTYILDVMFVALGLLVDHRIFYVFYAVLLATEVLRRKKLDREFFLHASIYSIILPDNYLAELVFLMYFIFSFLSLKGYIVKATKYVYSLFLFCLVVFVSTSLNFVPVINILFGIISFLPLFAFLWLSNYTDREIANCNDLSSISNILDRILFIEVFATIINFITHYRIMVDWSNGTFVGNGEQAQFLVVISFFAIYYFYKFNNDRKDKMSFFKLLICGCLIISTNSWLLLFLLFVGIGLTYLFSFNLKRLVSVVSILILLPLFFTISVSLLPEDVVVPVKRIFTDENYLDYRFHKLTVYKETFFEIPSNDIKFLLIGNGLGNYNSRGALICTGYYVDFYNEVFEPSRSEYTDEYITDYLELAYKNIGTDYGSVLARPYSSWLALFGETGILGLIIFFVLIFSLLKKKSFSYKLLFAVWLCFCFAENYFEYPKVIIMLYTCTILLYHSFPKQKELLN